MVSTVELEISWDFIIKWSLDTCMWCNQIDPGARLIIDFNSNFLNKNSIYFLTQIKVHVHKLIV